ncbi:hypothetical protein QBC43DRAFT_286032 [Cladorrhinum sp. PSN259]|nr:hypothetical protein QBC43DRAFT_286032 [Cladorrhinum sp. PSN259]
MEGPLYQTYPQHAYPFGAWDNSENHHFDGNNDVWMDNNLPMTAYDTTATYQPTGNGNLWPTYASFPGNAIDGPSPSTVASSPSIGVHGQGWPQTPNDPSTCSWEQPLPSPHSEIPPYSQFPFLPTQPQQPATVPSSSISGSTKAKSKGKGKAPVLKPAKKSDASSPKARSTKRKSPSPASKAATPHIGIFPPNVDPKKASEKMQREAWEKAKMEALAMSQRRLMLLDHERGALDRETQKLQVNIGLMRESVARQHSELQEAISKAERLNRQC